VNQVDGGPLPSSVINALQDMIIGAKHPELEVAIHAADFQVDGTSGTLDQNGYWLPSALGYQYAPLRLSVGTRINSVTFYYNVAGAGAVTPKVRRMQLSTGTISDVTAGVRDTTGVAIETQVLAPAHVVVTGYVYFLEVKHENAANKNYGAVMKFDRL
jgi:hypothetical protein